MADLKKCNLTDWLLLGALLAVGGFHEFISAALAVVFAVYLIVLVKKNKGLAWKDTALSWALLVLVVLYGISALWAVDSGMAFIGFLKFLPVFLYLLILRQTGQGNVTRILPIFGAVSVVISAVCMQLPVLENFFGVVGRLAGFFQYPNTYGLFLLVCQLLLLKKGIKKWDFLTLAVLLGGFLYTGSRTVFVLAVLVNVAWFAIGGRKRLWVVLAICGVLALGAVMVLLWGEGTVLYRYLKISVTQSTFMGRILYMIDSLPLLVRYPLGMGFMGYQFTQGSVQTGVYSVAYVHNDILQVFLDVGWIGGGVFLGALIRYFCRKDISWREKLIPGTIVAHSLFDFDLQFVAIFMLLVVLMEPEQGSCSASSKVNTIKQGAFALVAAVCLYMGVTLGLSYFECRTVAQMLYPYNSMNMVQMLQQEVDLDKANGLADQILAQNDHCFGAYSVKSKYAYSQGDFSQLIYYKRLALAENPFEQTEYVEYCQMLMNGIAVYEQNGDNQSADICRQELVAVYTQFSQNRHRLSYLGSRIDTQPVLKLPEAIVSYVEAIGEGTP